MRISTAMTAAAISFPAFPFTLPWRREPRLHSMPTQEELFLRITRGDRTAFSEFYDQLSGLVFGLALRTTRSRTLAEEVTQEVFLQVWRQADRFEPAKGSARAFVATLAHRRSVDVVRRSQAAADREEALPPQAATQPDVADEVADQEERSQVRAALGGLSDLQREAIELAYFGGLTYKEVADRLDTPLGTIKSRMRDGLARIRMVMEAGYD